jgi:hypothetical protein
MDKTTIDLCTQASYQIEAMCFALKTAARSDDVDALPYLVQSMAQRINDLSMAWSTCMSAVWLNSPDTADKDIEDFERVVFGYCPKVTE